MNIKKEDISILFIDNKNSKLILYKEGEGRASFSILNKRCLFFIKAEKSLRYWNFYICKGFVSTRRRDEDFFLERFSIGALLETLNKVIRYPHIQRKIIEWNLKD